MRTLLPSLWFATLGRTAPFADPCERPHKVVATSRDGILVDHLIEPLVEALWEEGIETYSSCQGEKSLRRLAAAIMPNLIGQAYRATVTVDTHNIFPLLSALQDVSFARHVEPPDVVVSGAATAYAHIGFDPHLLSRDGADEIIDSLLTHREAQRRLDAAAKRKATRERKRKSTP